MLSTSWLWPKIGDFFVNYVIKSTKNSTYHLWEKFNWSDAAERYRGEMQLRYSTMRIIGMASPTSLADIFTDVYLLDKPSAWMHYNIDDLKITGLEPETIHRNDDRRKAIDIISKNQKLMILGKPGAGKTTLLKHLVLECTTGKFDAIPIFISLKAWYDTKLSLLDFISVQFNICQFPNARSFIEYLLKEGKALILFDGLDEVNMENNYRNKIISEITSTAEMYYQNRYIITCRTAANEIVLEKFVYCEVADFTITQMKFFVQQWFGKDVKKYESFINQFNEDEHNRFRDLARSPLLLTLLCLSFNENLKFPKYRSEVYEEAINALLKKWDASRSIERDVIYKAISPKNKHNMLTEIAYISFESNNLFMRYKELEKWISDFIHTLPKDELQYDIEVDVILQSIEAQHGLIVERASRIYSFSHLTFHEYFTASYIAEHPSDSNLQKCIDHAYDPRWREIILLTSSLLNTKNLDSFINSFILLLARLSPNLNLIFQYVTYQSSKLNDPSSFSTRGYYIYIIIMISIFNKSIQIYHLIDQNINKFVSKEKDITRSRNQSRSSCVELIDSIINNDNIIEYITKLTAQNRSIYKDIQKVNSIEPKTNEIINTIDLYDPILKRISMFIDASQIKSNNKLIEDFKWISLLMYTKLVIYTFENHNRYEDYYKISHIWHALKSETIYELKILLSNIHFPEIVSTKETWVFFYQQLNTTLKDALHMDFEWNLSELQIEDLKKYLDTSTRLIECISLINDNQYHSSLNNVFTPK